MRNGKGAAFVWAEERFLLQRFFFFTACVYVIVCVWGGLGGLIWMYEMIVGFAYFLYYFPKDYMGY